MGKGQVFVGPIAVYECLWRAERRLRLAVNQLRKRSSCVLMGNQASVSQEPMHARVRGREMRVPFPRSRFPRPAL